MKRWGAVLGVFLAALAFGAAGLGSFPLVDRDEPRFAESAREMIERGDYLVPHFNGEPRYDKPPLMNWCQALAYRAFGENDFAARFPSALAAALVAALVFAWARGVYGSKAALGAAAVFLTSLQTLYLARAAVADMALVFFMTAAAWAAWALLRNPAGPQRRRIFAGYSLALAGAFLAKGPVALVIPAAALIYAVRSATGRKTWAWLLGGAAAGLAVFALWAVPAYRATGGEYFRIGIGRHLVERSLRPLEGHGPQGTLLYLATLPYYLVVLAAAFSPWSIYLASAAGFYRKKERAGDFERYLGFVVLGVFALFTPLKTKLPHYIFPAFPFLAILTAGYWFRSGRAFRPLGIQAGTMAALALAATLAAGPALARHFPAWNLYQMSRAKLKPGMEFGTFDFNEPSVVWYFRKSVRTPHRIFTENDSMRAFLSEEGPRLGIVPSEFADVLVPPLPGWILYRARGMNPAKGTWEDLFMAVRPD